MRCFFTIILILIIKIAQPQSVIIINSLPTDYKGYDSIYFASDTNYWNPCNKDFKFTMNNSGKMELNFNQHADTVYFKICRGSWKSVECDLKGIDVQKHRLIKNRKDTLYISIDAWRDIIPKNKIAKTDNKNVRFIPTQINMPQLDKKRTIRIYLPPNYFKYKSFPVIYMHDAQNIFDNSSSLTRSEWRVDEIMDALHYSRGFSAIVVGIYCNPQDRAAEFTPWDDETRGIKGDGDKYAKFIVKTLKPFIDSHYRSNNKREQTSIIGSGLGALSSIYTALEYPEFFGCVGTLSPEINQCQESLEYFQKIKNKEEQRIYIAAGEYEGNNMVNNIDFMVDALKTAGFDTLNIRTNITPHGQSEEWYWSEEFEKALIFFYNLKHN